MTSNAMQRRIVPFGLYDDAGREFGAYVVTWEVGGTLYASVRRARGDKHYGRPSPPARFDTEAERDAHILERIERLHLGESISRMLLQKLLALVD